MFSYLLSTFSSLPMGLLQQNAFLRSRRVEVWACFNVLFPCVVACPWYTWARKTEAGLAVARHCVRVVAPNRPVVSSSGETR
jgi:hypothetical protein